MIGLIPAIIGILKSKKNLNEFSVFSCNVQYRTGTILVVTVVVIYFPNEHLI